MTVKRDNGHVAYSFEELRGSIDKIAERMALQKVTIDTIVAIASGGWIPGVLLKRRLSTKENPLPTYSISIQNYDHDDVMLKYPFLYQPLPSTLNLENKSVLLVDEVADSGRTFARAREHLLSFNPRKIYTAVLHQKESSLFYADFIGEHVGNSWIDYPWEYPWA